MSGVEGPETASDITVCETYEVPPIRKKSLSYTSQVHVPCLVLSQPVRHQRPAGSRSAGSQLALARVRRRQPGSCSNRRNSAVNFIRQMKAGADLSATAGSCTNREGSTNNPVIRSTVATKGPRPAFAFRNRALPRTGPHRPAISLSLFVTIRMEFVPIGHPILAIVDG